MRSPPSRRSRARASMTAVRSRALSPRSINRARSVFTDVSIGDASSPRRRRSRAGLRRRAPRRGVDASRRLCIGHRRRRARDAHSSTRSIAPRANPTRGAHARDARRRARARGGRARARGASARAVADASRGQMRGVAPPRGVARARSAARRRWRARRGRARAEARGRGGRAARRAATTRGTRRRFGPRLKLENFAFGDRSTRARRDARGSGRRRRRAMG